MNKLAVRILLIAVITGLALVGCATVPKETVELSYTIGQDLDAVHSSYKALIQKHFESLRTQTTTFFNNRWLPNYLKEFISSGGLIGYARDPDPVKAYEGVSAWAEVALEEIDNKKMQLLAPIDKDEKQLLASVDEAFSRLIRANAAVTAQLNSIRKVQEVQDETLKALNLKDLRDKINQQLISSSEKAEIAIQQMEKAKIIIKDTDQKKQELIKKFKGGK